jgi:hypothetical protein
MLFVCLMVATQRVLMLLLVPLGAAAMGFAMLLFLKIVLLVQVIVPLSHVGCVGMVLAME